MRNIEADRGSCILKKAWTWPSDWILHHDNAPAQGTLSHTVSGLKIDYWNGIPTLFPWFGSKWFLALSKNKVCIKGTKISGYWRHPKKIWRWHWKLFLSRSSKKCFQQWQHHWAKRIAAQEEHVEGDPFQ